MSFMEIPYASNPTKEQLIKVAQIICMKRLGIDVMFNGLIMYGGRVYGTSTEKSDWDLLGIADLETSQKLNGYTEEQLDLHSNEIEHDGIRFKIDLTLRTAEQFAKLFQMTECVMVEAVLSDVSSQIIWTPYMQAYRDKFDSDEEFSIIKKAMRHSYSAKTDWAGHRAIKKAQSGEKKAARSSAFHQYRLFLFALQIAKHRKIVCWTEANDLWTQELQHLSDDETTEQKMKELRKWITNNKNVSEKFNHNLSTEFKNTFPK